MSLTPCLILSLLALPGAAPRAELPQDSGYARELEHIYSEYVQLGSPPEIAALVRLDRLLRDITARIAEDVRANRSLESNSAYREAFRDMGLYIGHWSGYMQYSGALLARAHRQDPNSRLRPHTLYAAISSSDPAREPHGMPDMNAAFQYAAEFPNGPFIAQTYEVIATFHDDLYKALRKFMAEKIYDDDVYMACFRQYMTDQPYENQRVQAQVLAHHFYEKALLASGENADLSESITRKLENFREMLGAADQHRYEVWYWCSAC
ncbi:MAG: hypothetical protein KF886_17585 [Candidatus Hydrogenedentes bacterium]|nr:hypothetical protein [Candidatus Hydrogenedentota bacterium]